MTIYLCPATNVDCAWMAKSAGLHFCDSLPCRNARLRNDCYLAFPLACCYAKMQDLLILWDYNRILSVIFHQPFKKDFMCKNRGHFFIPELSQKYCRNTSQFLWNVSLFSWNFSEIFLKTFGTAWDCSIKSMHTYLYSIYIIKNHEFNNKFNKSKC